LGALGRPFIEICATASAPGRATSGRGAVARHQIAAAIQSLASALWQGLDQPQDRGSDASIGYLVERLYKAQIVPPREKGTRQWMRRVATARRGAVAEPFTGTPSTFAICMPAPTRFAPFSYFWIC